MCNEVPRPTTLGDDVAGRSIQEQAKSAYYQGQAESRAPLRARIVSRSIRAQQEADSGYKLARLSDLLDKHPEVGQIIELLTELNLV